MNNNLLIVGAGVYGIVASEIAQSMNCFGKIAFVDDNKKGTHGDVNIVGTCTDIEKLAGEYANAIVAIGNPEVRLSLLRKFEKASYNIATLISPQAYISPSAQIMKGSIVEPMVVVHTKAVVSVGCIISAGAVINHESVCCDGVHVDCNATVEGYCTVPRGTTINSGEIFKSNTKSMSNFFNS